MSSGISGRRLSPHCGALPELRFGETQLRVTAFRRNAATTRIVAAALRDEDVAAALRDEDATRLNIAEQIAGRYRTRLATWRLWHPAKNRSQIAAKPIFPEVLIEWTSPWD